MFTLKKACKKLYQVKSILSVIQDYFVKTIFANWTYPSHSVGEQSTLINKQNIIFCFNIPLQRMGFEKRTLHEGRTTTNGNNNNIECKLKLPD